MKNNNENSKDQKMNNPPKENFYEDTEINVSKLTQNGQIHSNRDDLDLITKTDKRNKSYGFKILFFKSTVNT